MAHRSTGLLSALPSERRVGLSDQLVEMIRELILDGVWKPGDKLPGSRLIARDAKVSRATVLAAIDALVAEGLLEARDRSGTYVASQSVADRTARPREQYKVPSDGPVPFETCAPPLDLFPLQTWRRLQSRRWWSMPRSALQGTHGAGLTELREAIANHLRISRSIRCDPEQVIVTTGAESAILLAATALALRGAMAWTEDPTYDRQFAALHAAGVTSVPVPLDAHGFDIARARMAAPDARLAVVTPSAQFPTTVMMSAQRKRELVDWAVARGGWIIEDDYDCEHLPAGAPKPMAAMPGNHRVIYVNTFSRSLFLALRIGYLVVPPALIDSVLRAHAAIDEQTTAPNQLVLCDFLAGGHFTRHVRRCREAFATRREVLLTTLRDEFGPALKLANANPTSHFCIDLDSGTDDAGLAARAAAEGIKITPLSSSFVGKQRPGLLLGFGPHTTGALRDAAHRVIPLLREAI
jgi:GntR family transcriptional regulator/MocR family aminotransferase